MVTGYSSCAGGFCRRQSPSLHFRSYRRLDNRSVKELGISGSQHPNYVPKGKLAELCQFEMTVLDHLPGFRKNLAYVGDVPMTYVRSEHRIQPRSMWEQFVIESQRIQRIVRLATEEKLLSEHPRNVLRPADPGLREIVYGIRSQLSDRDSLGTDLAAVLAAGKRPGRVLIKQF